MKVETRVMEKVSTVRGDDIAMSLDENATAHLMSVLTDLYSDPELAVLREYSTNALDAHVQSGNPAPVEVTTPSPLAPFFRVRDYGTGLSHEDIRDTFSRYGTSTKRDTNDAVGMLGLGCKSALTYADTFTVVSTKDGRTIQVQVSRDEDGGGTMTVVSDEPSDAPNGTEIVVPAKRGDTFSRKADEFFRYWTPGTVLVDGKEPARVDGLWISDTLLLSEDVDADVVVMGNVSYPMSLSEDRNVRPSWRKSHGSRTYLVAFVPIGSVDFTPSRESLQLTKRTRAVVAKLYADAEDARDSAVRKLVADADSPSDAIRVLREGQRAGFVGDATFQGKTVPLSLDRTPRDAQGNRNAPHPDDMDAGQLARTTFLLAGHRYAKVKGERVFSLPLDGTPRLFFQGFDGRNMTPTKRDKLSAWAEGKGLDVVPQVFADTFRPDEIYWTDGQTVYDWADVESVKLTRAQSLTADATRPRGSYVAFLRGQKTETVLAEDIDTTRPVYWFQGGKYDALPESVARHSYGRGQGDFTGALDIADATVVVLPANRVDKFVRDFPSAVSVDSAVRANAKAWASRQSDDALSAFVFQRDGNADRLKGLDGTRISDPVLSLAIREAGRDTRHIAEGYARFRGFVSLPALPDYADALSAYPLLLDGHGRLVHNQRDVEIYVNAAYAARKDADSASRKGDKNVP